MTEPSDRLYKIIGVNPDKAENKPSVDKIASSIAPQSDKDPNPYFNGTRREREDIQSDLNDMTAADRMVCINQDQRNKVLHKLRQCRKRQQLEDGKALYEEYKENIQPEYATDESEYDGYFEPPWVSRKYLDQLHAQKAAVAFWEDI